LIALGLIPNPKETEKLIKTLK
jgi:hypothetical protein